IDSPGLIAEHSLAQVLGCKRVDLYLKFGREVDEAELALLRERVRRRGQGEPLDHLLGTVEFCGHTFLCDKRALVPRPETEQLVEIVESKIENRKSKILDVGTGSGVIALTLARKFPEAQIFAVDVSEDALELGFDQSEALLSALAEKNYRDICWKNDYSGVTRFLFARYGQDSHPRRPPAFRVD